MVHIYNDIRWVVHGTSLPKFAQCWIVNSTFSIQGIIRIKGHADIWPFELKMGVTDRSPQDASIYKSFKVINEVTDHKHKINKEKSQRLLWPSPFVPKWAWQYGSSRYIYKIFKFHSKCNNNQLSVLYFPMKGPSDLAKIQVTSTFDLYMGVVHRTH